MSKPRICKTCKWLRYTVEPCCSCSQWGKGKTDHYIPAEETLGEYLKRKEREENKMSQLKTEAIIKSLKICNNIAKNEWECNKCIFSSAKNCTSHLIGATIKHIKFLERELIDERDRYDRLVSFELAEAEELWALREAPSSTADAAPLSIEGKVNGGDDTVRRCAEYLAEKHLQEDETEWQPPVDYWRNICGINARQEKKGVEEYGQRLEDNTTLSTTQRIEHAQEELIDALKYLEHLKVVTTDKLTANDYQRAAMRTAGEYETNYDKLRNAAYGLNGEAGEVIDLLKKHEFQGHELPDEKLIDECGDVLWYCALLADALGFTLEQVMNRNIDKLRKRYPDGFDKARSINREG